MGSINHSSLKRMCLTLLPFLSWGRHRLIQRAGRWNQRPRPLNSRPRRRTSEVVGRWYGRSPTLPPFLTDRSLKCLVGGACRVSFAPMASLSCASKSRSHSFSAALSGMTYDFIRSVPTRYGSSGNWSIWEMTKIVGIPYWNPHVAWREIKRKAHGSTRHPKRSIKWWLRSTSIE